MIDIDLHTHSTYSDGTFTPKELFALAKGIGLKALALTDHDTVAGLNDAAFYAKEYEIEFVPGVELVAEHNSKEYHILGLYIDYENIVLIKTLNELIYEKRVIRNKRIIEKLNSIGIKISLEDLANKNDKALLTRTHFASALVRKGYCRSLNEAFHIYLGEGKPAYVIRETLTPTECIETIHNCNGIAILAHPTLYHLDYKQIDQLTVELMEYGLDGIEAYYTRHTNEDTAQILTIAHRRNLVVSGGSDFHGENKANTQLGIGQGNLRIDYKVLENIKQYIKANTK